MPREALHLGLRICQLANIHHWSRVFEYPWALCNGNFHPREWVLDAAGGDGILQLLLARHGLHVVNVDLSPCYRYAHAGVTVLKGDLEQLDHPDAMFHKVLCVSVLEHVANPARAIRESWGRA